LNAALVGRAGGIAGLLGVVLGLALSLGWVVPVPAVEGLLQALPNLAVVVWLIGVAAIQSPRLGRLGSMGLGAATAGLLAIITLNLFQRAAGANPDGWASALLASPAMPLVLTAAAVLFSWGILALGTASLKAGVLPRGAVVLWMVGMMASLTSSWPPVSLVVLAGVLWSSIVLLRGIRATDHSGRSEVQPVERATVAVAPDTGRLVPLDALRGVIMILMAIDHASIFIRRWHPFETWDQPLPDYPSLAALLTRLATHPCAPGFYFLMGAGMVLFARARRRSGWSERRINAHLALRGLLFIILEQLIVDVASTGQVNPFEFSILAGLGAAMLFGILFLRLSAPVQAAAGAAIVLLMQVVPGLLLHADLGVFSPIRLLVVPGSVGVAFVLYPPIPWLGVVLLGMAFAGLLQDDQEKAYKLAAVAGLACLALFPVVRALGGFGNLRMPSDNGLLGFLNLIKYPPSLSFLLLSLGFDLVILYLFSRASLMLATWGRPVVILGQAALYFFLVHWFVYASLGIALSSPGGLPQTYLAWVVGLILLYPACKAFESFKHRMPATSVWRMI
jgi:uncharacterized membrane protein